MTQSIITVAHSPDSDDAFMFYALARDRINTGNLKFEHTLQDIQTLNEAAFEAKFDVSAISFAAYPLIAHNYLLLSCGSSMGEKEYGPLVVAKKPVSYVELSKKCIAIPGKLTTATHVFKLFCPEAMDFVVMPFDQILESVKREEVDCGLLIHEGQLFFKEEGLTEVVNLGRWWWEREKLPLPLGGNVLRRSLPKELQKEIAKYIHQSIAYALAHKEEALDYALSFARGLSAKKASTFVSMYVNERTLDLGVEGRLALQKLLPSLDLEFVEAIQ